MNPELAKQLKDAGWPQEGEGYYRFEDGQSSFNKALAPNAIYIPTLSELIEACGDLFGSLERVSDGFYAVPHRETRPSRFIQEKGSTPEEAVANLWLALHAKP